MPRKTGDISQAIQNKKHFLFVLDLQSYLVNWKRLRFESSININPQNMIIFSVCVCGGGGGYIKHTFDRDRLQETFVLRTQNICYNRHLLK